MARPKLYHSPAEQMEGQVRRNRESRARIRARARHPRHSFDEYHTPGEVIAACLDCVPAADVGRVLDVGCHDGRWGLAARRRWPAARLFGIDVRPMPQPPEFCYWRQGDFLTAAPFMEPFDLIVSNPPYVLAEPMIRAALGLLVPGGFLVCLLGANFIHGKKRSGGLLLEHPPRRIYPLKARVRYHSGSSGTRDSVCVLWESGYRGEPEWWRGAY